MLNTSRGSGNTTRQMKSAPIGTVFVWCNGHIDYPKRLSVSLQRSDLKILRLSVLDHGALTLRGLEFSGLVIDHAAELSEEQLETVSWLLSRVRKVG